MSTSPKNGLSVVAGQRSRIVGMRALPGIEQIVEALLYQVAVGTAHLTVAKGLAESDPVVLNAAPGILRDDDRRSYRLFVDVCRQNA